MISVAAWADGAATTNRTMPMQRERRKDLTRSHPQLTNEPGAIEIKRPAPATNNLELQQPNNKTLTRIALASEWPYSTCSGIALNLSVPGPTSL
jgi:hypothetical protein